MEENKTSIINGKVWLAIVLFGLFGQIAWSVENMYFNLFLFNKIGGSTKDIQFMVMASGIAATVTTLLMGALSDKLNKRKIFICWGYVVWGLITAAFSLITRENFSALLNKSILEVATVTIVTVIIMDCIMTFFGSTANDAAFNSWITDITDTSNRGRVEGVLSALPLFSMLIVAGVSGIIIDKIGYPYFFISLGGVVTVCGFVGLFILKESGSGIPSNENYFKDIFYGFKPKVIKENKYLYLTLSAVGIYGIATQIFMPYLIIYMQHFLKMPAATYSLVLAVVILLSAITGIILGRLVDKLGKNKFMFISVAIFSIGLLCIYFIRSIKSNIVFGILGYVMLAGFILIMIILNAIVRDNTPKDKVGLFQGIRMIFYVLIPMIIGPMIGNAVIEANATKYPGNVYLNEYGEINLIPSPEIFLVAGLISILIVIPLFFLYKTIKEKDNKINKTDSVMEDK